jgi:Ca2+-binding EF-hand superfamily protein
LSQKKQQFITELKNKLSQKSYGSNIEEMVLLRAFKYFDLQNTGFCSKDIFTRTMLKIGITSLSDIEIAELFEQFHPNQDGLLDYKEFVSNLYSNKSISSKKNKEENKTQVIAPEPKEIQKNLNKKEFLNQTPVEKVLNQIREKLSSRGIKEVCSIARYFRVVDENNTQTIDFKEFKKCCEQFQLNLTDNEIQIAFVSFDRDNTGEIDYDEFLRTIRGDMNDFRRNLVNQVFNKLDLNGNGEISFDELQAKYSAKNHPEVLSGRKTENEVLKEFMDTFQDTYNYLCGTETDNIITLEEFMEYYENISMTIDNDEYFEILLNNAWNLNNQNTNKKAWANTTEEKENNNKILSQNYQEKFGDRRPGQTQEEAKEERSTIALRKMRKEILSRGCGGLISLRRQFKLLDENNSKTLDFKEFSNALNEYKINLTNDEIMLLFATFDKNENGVIEYDEFINLLRGPMNQKRKDIVTKAFNKLDIDKSGFIDMDEIKHSYNAKNNPDVKTGKKTEEEVYTEFMDTFKANHLLKSGPRSKRVTCEEFLDYYNNISMSINDDEQFIFLIQNAWKLNPFTYSRPKSINNINNEEDENNINNIKDNISNSNNKNINDFRKRDFNTTQAPFGVDIKEPKENIIKNNNNLNKNIIEIIEKLRNIISKRGSRGIMSIRREFMISDNDNNKTVSIDAFRKFCHDYRINLTNNEINLLFAELDKDKIGVIDYQEFLKFLIGEMNEKRKKIIIQVFKMFDKNKNGTIDLDDIRESYNAKMHPDVILGKKTEEEILAEFLDTFEYQFNLLNDEKENENKINMEEFMDYYNNISFGIKDDDYFEEMIKNVYNLDSKRNTSKKSWRGEY